MWTYEDFPNFDRQLVDQMGLLTDPSWVEIHAARPETEELGIQILAAYSENPEGYVKELTENGYTEEEILAEVAEIALFQEHVVMVKPDGSALYTDAELTFIHQGIATGEYTRELADIIHNQQKM